MATDKQEYVLRKYLTFDSYCFMSVEKAKMFIDMINRLSAPSVLRKDLTSRINENILAFHRVKESKNSLFCSDKTIDILHTLNTKGVFVKEVYCIYPTINNSDKLHVFKECVFNDKSVMVVDKDGNIIPSYFEILYQNGLYGLLDIIRIFNERMKGELDYEKK